MTWLWWLILGLLGGWLIELAIDFRFWRKRAALAQQRIVEQEAELGRKAQTVATREAEAEARAREIGVREETLAARDADLLAQARRIDERDQEISRVEQRLDARRAELDKHAAELIERERDIAARGQTLKVQESDHARREARIGGIESEQTRRQSSLSSRETALRNWEQRILSKEQDIGLRESAAIRLEHEHAKWKQQFEAMRAVFGSRYRTPDGNDDLQAIEGVGPKAVALLGAVGITDFERLSETPLGELSRLVEQGGAELALANPMSWAEQAALIVGEDYVGFENLKATLRGEAPLLAGHEALAFDAGRAGGETTAVTGAELVDAGMPLDVASLDAGVLDAGALAGTSGAAPEPDPVRDAPSKHAPESRLLSSQQRLEWAEAHAGSSAPIVSDVDRGVDAVGDGTAGGTRPGTADRAS